MSKILLIEDNEMNRDMLTIRLQHKGFEVITAADGEQGVNMVYSQQPDLILMDLSLPIKDGWVATREIKESPEIQHIPVIALTAHAMSGDKEQAIAAGCDDYEPKPIEWKRLLKKIETFIS